VIRQRGELFAILGLWDRAAADYSETVRLRPEDTFTRHRQILALLGAGELEAAQQAGIELLDRFRETTVPADADRIVSSFSVLTRADAASQRATVRLAEFSLNQAHFNLKRSFQSKLGAALYRAGRFEDAIRQLEEIRKARTGSEGLVDLLFLAMANERLSHRDVARGWLGLVRNHRSSPNPTRCWDELEIRLLRSEAEAVVIYDPIFPDDPFAH
jgi:tetratricopeptide (TPR) repeat protein